MKRVPDMIFIIDTNVEGLAVKEALKLNIPIVAIVDTNSDPTGINYPIPGNDDARRAINLYCDIIKKTILDAQKNISVKSDEKEKIIQKNDVKTEIKVENKDKKKPLDKKEKKPKKKTSFLSKIKNLTSKKSK